ncbi:MAG: SDR family oxidoreductase [Actinomycetota bacterium]
MDLGLRGRAAAVAAASSGIGRATALALADEGCDVAVCARREDRLAEVAKDIESRGVRAHSLVLDLVAPGACERFVNDAAAAFGRLDVVVTNVGGPPAGTFGSRDDDEFRRVTESNFMVHVRLARAAIPHMRARRWGRIVNVTSASVKMPIAGLITGNAARAATTAWAKTLSYEIASDGITINNVAPEAVRTERVENLARSFAQNAGIDFEQAVANLTHTPMGRYGTPEEAAAVIAFLASEKASFINGVTMSVDGGQGRALT